MGTAYRRESIKKRSPSCSTLLSCQCFGESSTARSEQAVDSRRSMLSSWSRFRAKKRTVPLDQPTILSEIEEEENMDMKMTVKVVQSSKKGFFRRFYKDNKKGTLKKAANYTTTITTKGSHQSPICNVLSKCEARTESATFPHCEPVPVRTRSPRTGLTVQPAGSAIRNQRGQRKKKKKKNDGQANVGGLIVLVMTLGTMLLGGRVPAILCMSALFYFFPYMSSATTTNDSDKRKGSLKMYTTT